VILDVLADIEAVPSWSSVHKNAEVLDRYRSWIVSRSESCAARTVLAAVGGCYPVDRHASWWVCRWAETAAPTTVARVTVRPDRWSARSGPLSVAGSCRPSPDRHAEATSTDRNRRGVMPRHRIGRLLLQGNAPVLVAPFAGVGRIDTDHRDAATGAHAGEAVAESPGGYSYCVESRICAGRYVVDMFRTLI
jgi:hypothetical protein